MAEEQINLVDYETLMHTLPPAISAALYQKGLAEIRGPPGIVRNTLEHMGMIETEKPGPEDEIEGCSGLFTRGNEAGELEKGLLDERGQPANLATTYRTMDVRGVLGAYFAKPVVKTIAGLLNGRKDYDTDEFIDGIETELNKADCAYELGEIQKMIDKAKGPKNFEMTYYKIGADGKPIPYRAMSGNYPIEEWLKELSEGSTVRDGRLVRRTTDDFD
jgi:hypothetical protein